MTKHKLLFIGGVAVVVTVILIFLFFLPSSSNYDFIREGDVIVGIGDSITAGGKTNDEFMADEEAYFKTLGDGYFNIVANELEEVVGGLTFYNSARNGTNATGWIERVYYHALDWHPSLIVMTLGANDFLFDTPQRYYEGLENTCYAIHKSGIEAIVVLPFCFDYFVTSDMSENPKSTDEMIEYVNVAIGIAEKYSFTTVDIGAIFSEHIENGTDPKELSEDGIHPTDLGEEILADAVLEAIDNL